MSLVSSLVTLLVVAGAGWFTIKYLIPKIESGEFGIPGFGGVQQSGAVGSAGEEELVKNELGDAINGLPSGTTEASGDTSSLDEMDPFLQAITGKEPARLPEGTELKKSGKKKGKGEYLSSEEAGKDNKKKKKKKTKKNDMLIYVLGDDYYYGYF